MFKKTATALFLASFLFVALESNAEAQLQMRQDITSGNQVIGPKPPYFAMHPPVYYDRIVPRAYGISPFAVPPGVMPVENSIKSAPVSISNPFYQGKKTADQPKAKKGQTASVKTASGSKIKRSNGTAKKISNPFFQQSVVSVR